MTTDAESSLPRPPIALILRLGVAGLAVAVIVLLVSGSHDHRTVSQVINEIQEIALARPEGGLIGPWWVSATQANPLDGTLENFKVECGSIHIAARFARVIVNPRQDSFRFEMTEVVFARIPQPGEDEDESESGLRELERYVLGPLPYRMDIIPDEREGEK